MPAVSSFCAMFCSAAVMLSPWRFTSPINGSNTVPSCPMRTETA